MQFRSIFEICQKPDAVVRDFWDEGEWVIPLRRSLFGDLKSDWDNLYGLLQGVSLSDSGNDDIKWALDKSQNFTTKSLFYCLTNGGVKDNINNLIWKCKIPLKVKVFLWQVVHKKLQTAMAFKKRGWQGSPLCCICLKPESVNHILYECVFAQFVWCCIRDGSGLQGFPTSVQEVILFWLPRRLGVPKRLCLTFFAGLAWMLWKNRNRMAIEKIFPSNPDAVIHEAFNLMQMWIGIQKEADKPRCRRWWAACRSG